MSEQYYSLGTVARLFGVKPHQVDYAITTFLVPEPELRVANHRVFRAEDVRRLAEYFGRPVPEQADPEPNP